MTTESTAGSDVQWRLAADFAERLRIEHADWKNSDLLIEVARFLEDISRPSPTPSVPSDKAVEAVSSIDLMQRRGAAWDIIQQALNSYDSFMLDDDYDSQRALNDIMSKMRDRFAAYAIDSAPAPEGEKQ